MGVPSIEESVIYRRFRRAIDRYEICSVLVYGRKGIGKTKVAMILAHSIYNDWDMVLDHLIFTPQQFSGILRIGMGRIPCLIFDDAGTWLNKYKYRSHEMASFCKLYDLMRSLVGVIIFTTPHPHNILRYVREDVDLFIKVKEYKGSIRECDIYERFYTHPIPKVGEIRKGTMVMEKMLIDLNDLPDEVYEKYLVARERAVEKAVEDFLNLYEEEEYYTLGEAARILGYSYPYLWNLVRKGLVNTVEVGGRKLVHRDELKRLLDLKGGKRRIEWGRQDDREV